MCAERVHRTLDGFESALLTGLNLKVFAKRPSKRSPLRTWSTPLSMHALMSLIESTRGFGVSKGSVGAAGGAGGGEGGGEALAADRLPVFHP